MNYKKLINESIQLYLNESYEEAFNLLTEYKDLIKGNPAQIENFRYSCLGKLGRLEEGYKLLEEAIKDKGYFYNPDLLLEDEDLSGFQQFDGFDELVKLCEQRYEGHLQTAHFQHAYVESDVDHKGLFVCLHGNQENMAISEEDWQSIFNLGYDGLFVQSDQLEFYHAYTWEDFESGAEQLIPLIQSQEEKKKLIVAGFSGGGQVALWSVLNNGLECHQLLLVAPWLPEIENWADQLKVIKDKNIKVSILVGDADKDCYEGSRYLHDQLLALDASVELLIFEGLDHEFPNDFEEILKEILSE